MAYHEYLKLEGGFLMIEYILKQCSLPDDPTDVNIYYIKKKLKKLSHLKSGWVLLNTLN